MSLILEILAWVFMLAGMVFFATGALGLLRFPDLYSRLHAITKTDTLGLGLLILGLAIKSSSIGTVLMLLIIWLLVLASSAVNCQLLASYNLELEANDFSPQSKVNQGDIRDA
jgi:multicomponent Na+:H+ antiporter subunit G